MKVSMGNGVELPNATIGDLKQSLWIYCYDLTFDQAYALFSDISATSTITWEMIDDVPPLIYQGYTSLSAINVSEGEVSARLDRPGA